MINNIQALAAASKTVHFLKILHSFHAHFLVAGEVNSKSIFVLLDTVYNSNYPTRYKFATLIFLVYICSSNYISS